MQCGFVYKLGKIGWTLMNKLNRFSLEDFAETYVRYSILHARQGLLLEEFDAKVLVSVAGYFNIIYAPEDEEKPMQYPNRNELRRNKAGEKAEFDWHSVVYELRKPFHWSFFCSNKGCSLFEMREDCETERGRRGEIIARGVEQRIFLRDVKYNQIKIAREIVKKYKPYFTARLKNCGLTG